MNEPLQMTAVRLSPAHREMLDARAKLLGLTRSGLLRKLISLIDALGVLPTTSAEVHPTTT